MATLNGVNYSSTSGLLLKTNATTQMSISTGGVIQFNQSYTFPTSDGSANTVLLTNGSGALSFSTIPNASLDNSSITINGTAVSLGGSINVGDITGVSAGNGLTGGGTSGSVTLNVGAGTGISVAADSVSIDYAGTNNFIDSATNLEGTSIAAGDTIVYHDATDNNVKKGFVSDLPFSNNNGTVTSVGITGTDGIDVDAGSPITTSGSITLGLSNIPNSSLANSSVTIGSTAISLGGTSTTLAGLTSVASTTFTGALSGNASTASKWANARTITLGTDLSGSVSIDGSANVSLNASIVAGAVGSTELATNAVTTVKITDGNVTNAKLSNSSVTIGSTAISLGGTSTTLAGLTSVTSTAFVGDLTGDVNGNASTADTWANSRTLTLGTDLSGNVSFNGSANFTLNASIVSGAVGSTELATNAVTTAKITDGNVTNAKLANSSFTVNAPSGSDPVVPLGGTLNFTSSDSSVVIAGNSSTDTIDLTVGGSVDTYVTGGTFTSGTLSLGLNDGSSAQDITGFWSSIPNSALSNSSITINGSAVSLGGSINVGDITAVTAGNGLTGGGTSGAVTVNVGAGTGISVAADTVGLDTTNSRNVDHDSVSISAGTGLTGGGTIASTRTISIDYAGTDNFIDSATNLEGTDIALTDTIIYHDATDNNVKKGLVSDLPFTNSSGSVTSVAISGTDGIDVDSGSPITSSGTITLGLSNVPNASLANSSLTVTGGNGLTGGGAVSLGGSVTLNVGAGTLIDVDGSNVNVDLSELATSTSNGDGDFFVVVDSANAQKKLTKGNINISGFNNDAGYITSAGNTNLYSTDGTLAGTRTVSQGGRDLQFSATGTDDTKFYKSTTTTNSTTRVFIEADDSYQNVLELFANGGGPNLVEGYDQGQAPVFRVDAQGNLTAVSKAFDIPHPNPEKKERGMRLKHGNLEGPEHGVYIRGRQLNDKEIELPEYWRDLVDPDSITVQLTSVGSHQNLYVKEIKDNVVYIGNGNLFSNKIDCYYFIQAERKDIEKITVEY